MKLNGILNGIRPICLSYSMSIKLIVMVKDSQFRSIFPVYGFPIFSTFQKSRDWVAFGVQLSLRPARYASRKHPVRCDFESIFVAVPLPEGNSLVPSLQLEIQRKFDLNLERITLWISLLWPHCAKESCRRRTNGFCSFNRGTVRRIPEERTQRCELKPEFNVLRTWVLYHIEYAFWILINM